MSNQNEAQPTIKDKNSENASKIEQGKGRSASAQNHKLSQPKVVSSAANHMLTAKNFNGISLDTINSIDVNEAMARISWSSRSWPLSEPHPLPNEIRNTKISNDLRHILHGVFYQETNDSVIMKNTISNRNSREASCSTSILPMVLRRIEPSINLIQELSEDDQISHIPGEAIQSTRDLSNLTFTSIRTGDFTYDQPNRHCRTRNAFTSLLNYLKIRKAESQLTFPANETPEGLSQASSELSEHPSILPPPTSGAPPTYSATMRIIDRQITPRYLGLRRQDIAVQSASSSSFIAPIPPPSYGEVRGMYTDHGSIMASVENLNFGPQPISVICPRCATLVLTSTFSYRSNLAHFSALALCLCGCWPCCLLPYCMDSCKNTYHHCPTCHTFLGLYTPW